MKSKKQISIFLILTIIFSLITFKGDKFQSQAGINEKHVLHIIWDGISNKLYEDLIKEGNEYPNIAEVIDNGTRINNMKTTIPSYGGAQAAILTGAYPETNGFLYRYYDKAKNAIISSAASTYKLNGETYFENIKNNFPNIKTLALGMSVASLGIEGRGVSASDENHKLIEYKQGTTPKRGDTLVSFKEEIEDLKAAISEEDRARYILAYSNDIKMMLWNGGATNYPAIKTAAAIKIKELDLLLGELISLLKSENKYDDTIIIINSLSSIYGTEKKINGDIMAKAISDSTGVKTQYGVTSVDTKAVIIKNYVMKYGQLSFTNKATEEDKQKVLDYIKDKSNEAGQVVKEVIEPASVFAPLAYADYLLNPIDEFTFSQAGIGTARTDDLDTLEQFSVVSGDGVIKGQEVSQASLVDIVPSIAKILGTTVPKNNEGTALNIFDFQEPNFKVDLVGEKNGEGKYTTEVKVIITKEDEDFKILQYSLGEDFMDYKESFTINKDCTLIVKALDNAGNLKEYREEIKFLSLYNGVSLIGDFEESNGYMITTSEEVIIEGEIINNSEIKLSLKGETLEPENFKFKKAIKLVEGKNHIVLEASLNNLVSKKEYIVYKAVNPKITSAEEGAAYADSLIKLQGEAWPKATIEVEDITIHADEQGKFNFDYNLKEGENKIVIKATTGKIVKEGTISLYYITPVKIEITSHKDKEVVKNSIINLEGILDKSAKLYVNGEEVILSSENRFNKELTLVNGLNEIKVETDIRGIKSSKVIRLVYVKPEDNYVVYINWDGFANYYYEEGKSAGVTPVLDSLLKEGVYFKNASTGIPSITNAMQAAIVSGTYSQGTGNSYRYYDKNLNLVIQYARDNKAETIGEAAVRQGLKIASVHQFALQDRGTFFGDIEKAYIQTSDPSNFAIRFDEAIKLIKGEPVSSGVSNLEIIEIPRFLALYMDDLDAIGHNEASAYGSTLATSEKERRENINNTLKGMDKKLGEFIEACKERGIYDNMSFILTTDHGMSPFGQQGQILDGYGDSKLPDLVKKLKSLGYNPEILLGGQSAKEDTDLVIVTVGLQAQLSFRKEYSEKDVNNIIKALEKEEYIGQIMKNKDIVKRGSREDFADLLVSPKVPYSFKTPRIEGGIPIYSKYAVRGQHDSLDESSQHIFSAMWGKGIKKGFEFNDTMFNIDFTPTMCKLLGIEAPMQSTGKVLFKALIGNETPSGVSTGTPGGRKVQYTLN